MSEERSNQPTIYFKRGGFSSRDRRPVRLWPLLLILVGDAAFLGWTWYLRDVQRQDRILATMVSSIIVVFLALVWFLFLSRLRWKTRLLGGGALVCLVAVLASSVKFRSFTGDLVPIFDWRWSEAMREIHPETPTVNTNLVAAESQFVIHDFAQFLGPNRNATIDGITLARDWKAKPPRLLWRRPMNPAWAGFAVSGTNAVTLEQGGPEEAVTCYNLLDGSPLWKHSYVARYDTPVGGLGPRTVPLIVSNRVYAVGATGFLSCLDLATGNRIWDENVLVVNHANVPAWGFACSPLFVDGRIVVNPGGPDGHSLVAYDAVTGKQVWAGGDAPASYSSPVVAELAGVRQILMFDQPRICSHDVETGKVLWEYPWGHGQPQVAVPIIASEDSVMFSSGYGVGAELLKVKHDAAGVWTVDQVWRSIRMKAKFANMVKRDGFVYGLDDGMLACIDLKDGSQRWKEGRYGHGQMLLVGDLLLVTAEDGEIILLAPTPEAPNELSRLTAFDHKQWNPPALAGQLLVVRTDREAACYVLPLAGKSQSETNVVDSAKETQP
ncbi:PQQ-binding-like beta-propeller repeat protein [bacterium]|nr:PQQ-binding-like beta-propeller repeat protein [bacterium]